MTQHSAVKVKALFQFKSFAIPDIVRQQCSTGLALNVTIHHLYGLVGSRRQADIEITFAINPFKNRLGIELCTSWMTQHPAWCRPISPTRNMDMQWSDDVTPVASVKNKKRVWPAFAYKLDLSVHRFRRDKRRSRGISPRPYTHAPIWVWIYVCVRFVSCYCIFYIVICALANGPLKGLRRSVHTCGRYEHLHEFVIVTSRVGQYRMWTMSTWRQRRTTGQRCIFDSSTHWAFISFQMTPVKQSPSEAVPWTVVRWPPIRKSYECPTVGDSSMTIGEEWIFF